MSGPSEPDRPRPPLLVHSGVLHGRGSKRALLIAVSLLLIGGGLAYAALFRRWGYHPITPSYLSTLSPQDPASLSVSLWVNINDSCGPLPAIWPAPAILRPLPL